MYIAIDKYTHDMFKVAGEGIQRVSDGRFVVQQAQCKLRTMFGEWVLDRSIGFLGLEDMGKQYDLFDIELRVIEIVSGIQGVKTVYDVTLDLTRRTLLINFKAITTYGIIDTKVPWKNPDVLEDLKLPVRTFEVAHTGILVDFNTEQLLFSA